MKPIPTEGSQGEVYLAVAFQQVDYPFLFQKEIWTRFHPYPFRVDFLLFHNFANRLVVEVQGGLHRKTWGGRPAIKRALRDEKRANCLKADGYPVLPIDDTQILRDFTETCKDQKTGKRKRRFKTLVEEEILLTPTMRMIADALLDPDKYRQLPALELAELEENLTLSK